MHRESPGTNHAHWLRATLTAQLAALAFLNACGSSGSAGYGGSGAPAPAPPPPVTITFIDIAQPWTSAAAADVGMDDVRVGRAVSDAAAMPRFRSLLIARHGRLVSENYFGGADRSTVFDLRSVTKSVVSLLAGIAIQSGQLPGLDATVGQYLGAPYTLDDGDRAVTVRELLTMTSRYQWDENRGDDYNLWVTSSDHIQFLLDRRQTDPAGQFVYDSAAVNLLGFLLQKAVAEPLSQYATDHLFEPIGITSVAWEDLEPDMVNGGSGIHMTARDLLRFGQLVLQSGRSGAQQVVPEAWIATATSPKFPWRDSYGAQSGTSYGYLWWAADAPARPASFAWGYGGQFVYVVPTLDLVVTTTTEWQGISSETDPGAFAAQILTIIVNDVLPAARS
ncbi:MAG TPA: serine hydrolase [Steroidobacteraceae bacterium]|jgi:CubicO group peptidase (beta-lactamase class C family)